ncbi:MAG TPA: glycosyl hydrolase, partial [Terracidiphilus sp.]|nr:glycosyl hydrolase [Terracidiphilus sp.]
MAQRFSFAVSPLRIFRTGCLFACLGLFGGLFAGHLLLAQSAPAVSGLHRSFANPPDSARIMVRWWWFGPAVTDAELARELEQMKQAGIGGAEVANLYPLELDDPATGFRNLPFVSPRHLAALHFAADEAAKLGLRMDITLGSGWPFGGPHIPITEAAGKLRVDPIDIPAGSTSVAVPFLDTGEELINAFLLPRNASAREMSQAEPIPAPTAGQYSFAASARPRTLICFISSRTGMTVKRPSVGAEGFVLDHLDRAGIEAHLHAVGDPLLSAFGSHPPYAVFSDSLEAYGTDWTPSLLSEFARRRGYDLRPHLLALIADDGPDTAAVRHDWGRTLTELADQNYLEPLQAWATAHHTRLRSQTYGYPPVNLASNRLVDLPEGEGKATFNMWREFSDTRWAASAGHLFHRPVISSETWTWLHSPAFRATPLDMKAEADLHFLQGINQLVGHGWPYSPPSAGEPGWRMYAAAALNAHNPWFFAMPDLARYLQRVSYALRLGHPDNDVALLLPEDDVWASFKARVEKHSSPISAAGFDESGSNVSIDESMPAFLGRQIVAGILDAGFNVDFIDADAIDRVGIPYRVLILPGVDRLPAATYEKILAFAQKGGIVIATRRLPATAPGLLHAQQETERIRQISSTLFHGGIPTAHFLNEDGEVGSALATYLPAEMKLTPAVPAIGFIHRKLADGDLYFVANTSNEPQHVQAKFRDAARHAEAWDAFTGAITAIPDPGSIRLDLAPYESRLIFFSEDAMAAASPRQRHEQVLADLSQQWQVTFDGIGLTTEMQHLVSWSIDPRTRFFSGLASYTKNFQLKSGTVRPGTGILLDFGKGTAELIPSPP